MPILTEKNLPSTVAKVVRQAKITDIHTHLYDPHFSGLLLKGVDDLLTYHYLVAETFRWLGKPYGDFWKMPKPRQAELIWKTCFLDHSPISESCRGVLTSLNRLGLDTACRDLDYYRKGLAKISPDEYLEKVFRISGVKEVVMTNDPLHDLERQGWEKGFRRDPRFKGGLRIDPILLSWEKTWPRLKSLGYKVGGKLTPGTLQETRRFLLEWASRLDALYLMASFPPDFRYPDASPVSILLSEAMLPVCRELNRPFALMMGVKRQVNPELGLAGDGVGEASMESLERLCREFPRNKFLATVLARENHHSLAVASRKFRNLMPFGCWWFVNVPLLIEEITRMRVELLGASFLPQHSDSRVLDQLIYKWDVSREIIGKVLAGKYAQLVKTGWKLEESEIRRDVEGLLGGNFHDFVQAEF